MTNGRSMIWEKVRNEMNEQPEPNKLCPILMLCPPKTGTYGDIVCLQYKCAMWREIRTNMNPGVPDGEFPFKVIGYCGVAGKP
jgi:hypothetical protein